MGGDVTRLQKWHAPFTADQVAALNQWQTGLEFHPYTCGNCHPGPRNLIARIGAGWVCPTCDYTQDWAHSMPTLPSPTGETT